MDELRTEMLAGEEGARRDLATERDERITSGTEAMVAAAELQAWAEGAVARQAAELEAAVVGGVAEGLVASAATESVRFDAEVRHAGLAAEVAAQREALEAAFAEEKRKSWEQVSPNPNPNNLDPNPNNPDPNPNNPNNPHPNPNPHPHPHQVSEQGAALMGELAEEAEARGKAEVELREMLATRCTARPLTHSHPTSPSPDH